MRPCFYCGNRMQRKSNGPLGKTKDHVVPKSRGGSQYKLGQEKNGVVFCHKKCNADKANLTLEEYRIVIAKRKDVDPTTFLFPGEQF